MFDKSSYKIGWICALKVELVAARQFLDAEHDADDYEQPVGDDNCYVFGSIGKHNIAIAALPHGEYGTSNAATVARDLLRSFPDIKSALMVGIGGGIPRLPQHDIRLGDVIVSSPSHGKGGVLQYDFGKALPDFTYEQTGHLNSPPKFLLAAVTKLAADFEVKGHEIEEQIQAKLSSNKRLKSYGRPPIDTDVLHRASYTHESGVDCAESCSTSSQSVARSSRDEDALNPEIHYGLIASGNTLVRDSRTRDALAEKHNVLCVEMEAAGLMNHLPVLVVRGICDYADSHKNKLWQGYAAMTAAAYTRLSLLAVRPANIDAEKPLAQTQNLLEQWNSMAKQQMAIRQVKLKEIEDTKLRDVRQWLAPVDHTLSYRASMQQYIEGTCDWFSGVSMPFGQWRQGVDSILQVVGPSGAGKTMLASYAIKQLQSNPSAGSLVLYWYFDQRDPRKLTMLAMCSSLLWQLYCACAQSKPMLEKKQVEFRTIDQALDQETALRILMEALSTTTDVSVSIVVDGLDEIPAPSAIHEALVQISVRHKTAKLLVFRTAQDWSDGADDGLVMSLTDYIRPLSQASMTFIDQRLHQAQTKGFATAGDAIRQDLPSSSIIPNFRRLRCEVDLLLGMPELLDIQSLRDAELLEIYDWTLKLVPEEHLNHCVRLLQLLAVAQRPLHYNEIATTIYFDLRPHERELLDLDTITEACSGLVCVVKHEAAVDDTEVNQSSSCLLLSHSTVLSYVLGGSSDYLPGKLNLMAAHAYVAEACLTCLLEADEASDAAAREQYAAQYWPLHLTSGTEPSTVVRELVMRLLDDVTPAFKKWHAAVVPEGKLSPLELAARFGLLEPCKALLITQSDDPCLPSLAMGALELACGNDHKEVADALVTAQPAMISHDDTISRCLQAATREGYWDMIHLMLKLGANINARDVTGQTALFAAYDGAMIMRLVAAGIDPNARDYGKSSTALHHLCESSSPAHDGAIRALLKAGARTDIPGLFGNLPLHVAASSTGYTDRVDILKALLQSPFAKVDAQNQQGRTALHFAAAKNTPHRVDILLGHGASAHIRDENGQTPIFFAGCGDVVRSLCDKGNADAAAKDNQGYTMVQRSRQRKTQAASDRMRKINAAYSIR